MSIAFTVLQYSVARVKFKRRQSWHARRARAYNSITGIWGQSPQRGPWAEPLVRDQGGKPPESEAL